MSLAFETYYQNEVALSGMKIVVEPSKLFSRANLSAVLIRPKKSLTVMV